MRDALKIMIGRIAEVAIPGLGREIDEARETTRAPRLKRAIVYARLRRAHALGDASRMDEALAAYWRAGPGDKFYVDYADDHFRVFQEQHAVVIDVLSGILERSGLTFSRLVEIGCGDGQVLVEAVKRLPSISQAIGIDLNAAVIARVSAAHQHRDGISFVNAEARAWLSAHPQPGTVVFSNGGVLEYFSPENLDRLLQAVALSPPAAVVLVEPAAPHHDLENQPESLVFGQEYSFSHNYRSRLTQAGFDVVFEQETRAFGARLMMVIGILRSTDK
ncbi:MAG TPA: class I SAM-dependent methyltransferase [Phenylobacterium sp.]|jgi:SAM-dependent methyltransferase